MYKILFICKHNTIRSVIAHSLSVYMLPDQFDIESGGSDPKGQIDPVAKQFLQDKRLPYIHRYSHSWEERTKFLPDLVIILCDSLHHEPLPNWLSGGIRVNWQVDVLPKGASVEDKYAYCERIAASLRLRLELLSKALTAGLNREDFRERVEKIHNI